MCMYMYVCICMHVYMCMYICDYVLFYFLVVFMSMPICKCVLLFGHVCTPKCMYMFVFVHANMNEWVSHSVCVDICMWM